MNHRNTVDDMREALAIAKQAQGVASKLKDGYPADEAQWMHSNAWNKGLEMTSLGQRLEGCEWLGIGVAFAGLDGTSEEEQAKMVAHYTRLFNQIKAGTTQ